MFNTRTYGLLSVVYNLSVESRGLLIVCSDSVVTVSARWLMEMKPFPKHLPKYHVFYNVPSTSLPWKNTLQELYLSMLKHIIAIGCVIICTAAFVLSDSTKNYKNNKKFQHHVSSAKGTDLSDTDFLSTVLPTFSDRTSLKMLEDITAKVWRTLPVISVPESWVLAYCMRYTEISEEVQKATMECQYDGTDWGCAFIELGGGRDDFNIGKIVSLFHDLSNRELKSKLLRGTDICGKLWQTYKQVQEKRLTRMRLNVHVKNREKRSWRKYGNTRNSRRGRKHFKKKKEKSRDEEVRKSKLAAKEIKAITHNVTNRITQLENKQLLSSQEETELNQLRLTVATKPRINLEDYSIAEERAELSRLQEIGSCLSQHAAKACESVILSVVKKLI